MFVREINDVDLFFSAILASKHKNRSLFIIFQVNLAFQSNIVREAALRRSIPANRDTAPRFESKVQLIN